jgi:capsular exopolysaccharide synthesis family protein
LAGTPDFAIQKTPLSMEELSDHDNPSPNRSSEKSRVSAGEIVSMLIDRWYWIPISIALLGGLAHYYISKVPRKYLSAASVQVKASQASAVAVDRTAERAQASELDLAGSDAINTIIGKFKTHSLIRVMLKDHPDLLTDPGLLPEQMVWAPVWLAPPPDRMPVVLPAPPPPEDTASDKAKAYLAAVDAAAEKLAGPVGQVFAVTNRKGSRLVDIKVEHTNPDLSRRLADALVATYTKVHVDRKSDRTESTIVTIEAQTAKAQEDLQTSQNALAAYRTALTLVQQLKDQEAKLAELLLRYRDKHPDVLSARKLLAGLQDSFLREFDAARSAQTDRKYWESVELISRSTVPDDTVREAIRLLQARSEVLTSEILNRTQTYNILLTQRTGADVSSSQVEAEILPIESARRGVLTEPNPPAIYAAGILGGLLAGAGLSLLLGKLDNKIHTVTDLERATGAPVLASIAAVRRKVLAKPSGTEETSGLTWSPDLFFRDNGSRTVEAEMIRNLRTSIVLLGPAEKVKTILFTSALPAEGKSFVSANIAASFAMSGVRTVLVDLDLRRPRQQNMFGTDRKKGTGVADVLASQCKLADALHPSGLENLTLFLAGTHAPNPAELLNSQRIKDVIAVLRKHFDRVILDTAPLLPVSDTRLIANLADTCILVAGAEKTPKGAILRALELLGWDRENPTGSNIGGCVLNGTIESRRNLGYNYSYGYYGKYGRYGKKYGSVYGDDAEEEESDKNRRPKGAR